MYFISNPEKRLKTRTRIWRINACFQEYLPESRTQLSKSIYTYVTKRTNTNYRPVVFASGMLREWWCSWWFNTYDTGISGEQWYLTRNAYVDRRARARLEP